VTEFSGGEPGSAYGDALTMTDFARGGENTVTGSTELTVGTTQNLYGDAGTLSGHARGGDNLVEGAAQNSTVMYGDAATLQDHARGGGNTLIGASGIAGSGDAITNTMYGDGHDLLDHASGGGNTLVSGANAEDIMWGDAAVVSSTAHTRANTFVFAPQNGQDTIMDFRSGTDHIDLQGFGFNDFQQLSQLFHTTANGLDIILDANDSILLHGVSHVGAGDFVFT
jgi:hypothetical protein